MSHVVVDNPHGLDQQVSVLTLIFHNYLLLDILGLTGVFYGCKSSLAVLIWRFAS